MDEIIQIITDTQGNDEEAFIEALKAAKEKSLDDKAVDAALAIYRTLNAFRDSLDEADLGVIVKSLGYKVSEETEDVTDEDKTKADEEIVKAEEESVENGEGSVEDEGNSAVNDVLDGLRDEVNALKSDKRRAEFAEQVADLRIGKTVEEMVDMLMTIDKAKGDTEVMLGIFKTASNIAKAGIFDEFGSEGTGEAGDAYQTMKTAADALAKEEKITPTQGMAKLHLTRPELVQAYRDSLTQ